MNVNLGTFLKHETKIWNFHFCCCCCVAVPKILTFDYNLNLISFILFDRKSFEFEYFDDLLYGIIKFWQHGLRFQISVEPDEIETCTASKCVNISSLGSISALKLFLRKKILPITHFSIRIEDFSKADVGFRNYILK